MDDARPERAWYEREAKRPSERREGWEAFFLFFLSLLSVLFCRKWVGVCVCGLGAEFLRPSAQGPPPFLIY
jgi:hypothetical protein